MFTMKFFQLCHMFENTDNLILEKMLAVPLWPDLNCK